MDMAEGEDAGSDLYLIKPVLASKLLSMVGMFLSEDAPLAKKRAQPFPNG
jgi:DNA-binding response OmpR family regulator